MLEGVINSRTGHPSPKKITGVIPPEFSDYVGQIQADIEAIKAEKSQPKTNGGRTMPDDQATWLAGREALREDGQVVRDFVSDLQEEQLIKKREKTKLESAHFTPFDLNEIRIRIREASFPFVAPDGSRWRNETAYLMKDAPLKLSEDPVPGTVDAPVYNGKRFPIVNVTDPRGVMTALQGVSISELAQTAGTDTLSTLPPGGGREWITNISTPMDQDKPRYKDKEGRPLKKVVVGKGRPVPALKANEYVIDTNDSVAVTTPVIKNNKT